jgi:predicted Fe-Mo cluster-binding NifX family protein
MERGTTKVAIPHYRDEIAPCFEATAAITIFTIRQNTIVDRICFALQSREALDRVRLLRDQEVTTLICGGLQSAFEDLLRASGIRVFSWVSGGMDDLLDLFLEGQLVPGAERQDVPRTHRPSGPNNKTKKGVSRLP